MSRDILVHVLKLDNGFIPASSKPEGGVSIIKDYGLIEIDREVMSKYNMEPKIYHYKGKRYLRFLI